MFLTSSPSRPKDLSNFLNLPETSYSLPWPSFLEDNLVACITKNRSLKVEFLLLHRHIYLNWNPPFHQLDISFIPRPTHSPLPRSPICSFSSQSSTACCWPALFHSLLNTLKTLLPLKSLENTSPFNHVSLRNYSLHNEVTWKRYLISLHLLAPWSTSTLPGSTKVISNFLSVKSNRYWSLLIFFDFSPSLVDYMCPSRKSLFTNLFLSHISTFREVFREWPVGICGYIALKNYSGRIKTVSNILNQKRGTVRGDLNKFTCGAL